VRDDLQGVMRLRVQAALLPLRVLLARRAAINYLL